MSTHEINNEMVSTATLQGDQLPIAAGNVGSEDTGSQYLTFRLGDEDYGVDILRVQEIKGWSPVTTIPNTPEYLRGVLNLRGAIVPIIDLRMRLNLSNVEYTATTVVIVLCVRAENQERILGIVVDSVSDVLNVAQEEIRPSPDFGTAVNTEFIRGLATIDDAMIMLLDIDRLLRLDELKALDGLQPASAENRSP